MYQRPNILTGESVQAGSHYEVPKHFYEYEIIENNRIFIWNPLTGEFYGRNATTWGKIILIYFILYIVVIITFALILGLSLIVLSCDMPKYSFSQPGFTFAPICKQLEDYAHIKYNEKHFPEIKCLVKNVENFISKYSHLKDFGDCTQINNYGYSNRTPCIFLKLNRSIGFRLDPIDNAGSLPSSAPDELRTHLHELPPTNRSNQVWLSCQTNYNDRTTYFPYHGIPAKVLEYDKNYKNIEMDFQRIVAVQFDSIPVNKNVKIECYAWAKNIEREIDPPIGLGRGYLKLYIHIQTS